MAPFLLFSFLLAVTPLHPEPLRWVPLAFEKAAWVGTPGRMLLTDLGVFIWRDGRWESKSAGPQPLVPSLATRQTSFLSDELILGDGEASVTLLAGAARLLVLRRALTGPQVVELPAVDEQRATSLRLLTSSPDEWLVQGVTFAGDARFGVFLVSISRRQIAGSLIALKKGALLPAFAGGFLVAGETWLFPDRHSEDQSIWVRFAGKWRKEHPPSGRSVLLDAVQDANGIWLAFSDGVMVISGAVKFWFPLTVALVSNRWICEPPAPVTDVTGRWMRGAEPLGWGVGAKAPPEDYPMDGASCSFFTSAAGAQGFATPESVKISLTPAGSRPVTVK